MVQVWMKDLLYCFTCVGCGLCDQSSESAINYQSNYTQSTLVLEGLLLLVEELPWQEKSCYLAVSYCRDGKQVLASKSQQLHNNPGGGRGVLCHSNG